jgi:aspartyl-tRNA(Asn)/glutamyl-tRNA(Gln) amidotransferase subunit C
MALDTDTVRRIADLARIRVADDQLAPMAAELSGIMRWIELLNEVDTEGVAPMTGVADFALPMRDDVVTDGGAPEKVLSNAPERAENFFAVPKVVE